MPAWWTDEEPVRRGYYPERDEPAPTWAELRPLFLALVCVIAIALVLGWLWGPRTW